MRLIIVQYALLLSQTVKINRNNTQDETTIHSEKKKKNTVSEQFQSENKMRKKNSIQ
jgi:hypothetical protein